MIITGGVGGNDEVLKYDPDADKWVDTLSREIRIDHDMSLVPKETADYCV